MKMFDEQTMLRKALTSADTANLRSEDLDPVLHEELVEKQPLLSLFDVEAASGKVHEFRKISSHPKGWFEGESTPANAREGSYSRETVQLKILRNWGEVTGFNQAVTAKDLDILALEIDLSLQGLADIIEWSTLYGVADDEDFTGDPYMYTGLLAKIYSDASANVVDGGGNKLTLAELDSMLDLIDYRGTEGDPKFFIMSNAMKQISDGLQTQVQMNIQSAQLFDGKITMGTYDGIPIFKTNMVKSSDSGVTGLAAANGTNVTSGAANAEYGYRVSSITFAGEQVAVAEAAVTPTANYSVVLSWTADADAYAYMIWREPAAGGGHDLRDIIPAKTYDSAGTVSGNVTGYTDTDFSASSVNEYVQCLETGEQMIILANASNRNGASYMGMVDSMGASISSMVSYVPLARTKDSYDFMLKSYLAMKIVNPLLFSVLRHVKLA
jgi:hypothetical protein